MDSDLSHNTCVVEVSFSRNIRSDVLLKKGGVCFLKVKSQKSQIKGVNDVSCKAEV